MAGTDTAHMRVDGGGILRIVKVVQFRTMSLSCKNLVRRAAVEHRVSEARTKGVIAVELVVSR